MNPLKIAIVVHGRFHAFDLARALIERGHDVTVFTNYPAWAAARFGVPRERVRSFTAHGIAVRTAAALNGGGMLKRLEAPLHVAFGRWAARRIARERWDVVHAWSGVSEELLRVPLAEPTVKLLMRGSSHVATQSRLLQEEERRAGVCIDRPSDWMVARERREYQYADHVAVLSSFARTSFLGEGMTPDRVSTLALGVDLAGFRPPPDVVEQRCVRIEKGQPLQILYVGALSMQKGVLDLLRVATNLQQEAVEFHLVGAIASEAVPLMRQVSRNVRLAGRKAQVDLPPLYHGADVFIFPTIQDGYGMVLAQAQAAALPILATTNCAAPDLLREGEDGWVLPIRDPEAFTARLRWCLAHRAELAQMVRQSYERFAPRDWSDVAADFEALAQRLLTRKLTRAEIARSP